VYGPLGDQTVRPQELAANQVEWGLMCGESFVEEAVPVCVGGRSWLTGVSSGVQGRRRDLCVLKLPLATLKTLIAISMLVTLNLHASVGPRPSLTKSIVRKCRCHGRSAECFVLINL
jgi:hypothetical protein